MPIELEEFENGTEPIPRKREDRKPKIFAFLKEHPKEAYTQKEIADEFEIASPAARTALVALAEDGVVSRKTCEVEGGSKRIHFAYLKDYPEEKEPKV